VATSRVSYWIGTDDNPGNGAAASGGLVFNRDTTATGTSAPIPVPEATGTNYSFTKNLGIEVTAGDTNEISNRRIHRHTVSLPTGIIMFYKVMDNEDADYFAPAAPASDNGSTNDAVPATWTAVPTSATQYDNTTETATQDATMSNGDWVQVAVGVGNNYAGGAGTPDTPTIRLTWDEAPA